jgi:GTP-binding protein Era
MPVLTVYTKGDLVSAEEQAVLTERGTVVSAATGAGIDEMLARVREYLPPGEFAYDPDDVGTQPLRFFVVEYLREAAFEFLGEEVPYSFNAEVEEFRESTRPVYIRVTLFVERETQKAIVIGKGGQTIKALGGHARARLEALMGTSVYLDCWVKVLPRWRRDPAALTRFGFPASANHDKESV